ncbi:hypothetical protein Bca52824_076443 [Brassica carinata]|uniref:NAC domain-containing protein n=1 Tax=Brassica carinata TaxID=52824 RepID=A0A8X7PRM8_BRACI|nr:hypothetical protein Bca52824_076443 [Brassica carinata]
MSEVLSKGFRFHPADEELVRHYLMRKTSSPDFRCFIKTMEVFDSEPYVDTSSSPYTNKYKLVESEKWVICHLAYTHWNNDFEKPRYGGVEHPPLGWKLVKELVTNFQCFIKELEMFAKEPWLMELERSAFYREKEWYFLLGRHGLSVRNKISGSPWMGRRSNGESTGKLATL